MFIKYTLKFLLISEIVFILAIVPYARRVEAAIRGLWTKSGLDLYSLLPAIVAVALAILFVYYYFVIKRHGWRYSAIHLLVTASLLLLLPLQISVMPEYSHLVIYGLLAILFRLNFRSKRAVIYTLLGCVAVSSGDEFLQYLHPDRYCDLKDFLLNATSSIIGLLSIEPLVYKMKQS